MPKYTFLTRFVPFVESGLKCLTIRRSDRGMKPGMIVDLVDDNSGTDRLIRKAVVACVTPVKIYKAGDVLSFELSGSSISHGEIAVLAGASGFDSVQEMFDWYAQHYGLPFDGFMHTWIPERKHLKEL